MAGRTAAQGSATALPVVRASGAARAVCESCRRRPATVRVVWGTGRAYAVCEGCAPVTTPVRAVGGEFAAGDGSGVGAGEVPPVDWAGQVRVRQSWRDVAAPVTFTLLPAVLALVVFLTLGGTTDAFGLMVTVGVVTWMAGAWLDRRFVGRRHRRRQCRLRGRQRR